MPATSLFEYLSAAIFTGDSWKLALPAALYTISNSLKYIALSNFEVAQFQVTYQIELLIIAIFGVVLMRKSLSYGKWFALVLLVAGVALVQIPPVDPNEMDRRAHAYLPRRLSDLQHLRAAAGQALQKRSATYEGIQDDMIQGHPPFDMRLGLIATLGVCICSGLAGLSFEKVLRDSAFSTSLWIRNIQLAVYSVVPALFIGVIFLDGEQVAKRGFFYGYDWTVWTLIAIQAIGGIATSFCISYSEFGVLQAAGAISVVITSLASPFLFDSPVTAYVSYSSIMKCSRSKLTPLQSILGTLIVLIACFIYIPGSSTSSPELRPRPPPIRIEKAKSSPNPVGSDISAALPNDFSIKLPTTPLITEASALTTSRPGSPSPARHHGRVHSSRGYFSKQDSEG